MKLYSKIDNLASCGWISNRQQTQCDRSGFKIKTLHKLAVRPSWVDKLVPNGDRGTLLLKIVVTNAYSCLKAGIVAYAALMSNYCITSASKYMHRTSAERRIEGTVI